MDDPRLLNIYLILMNPIYERKNDIHVDENVHAVGDLCSISLLKKIGLAYLFRTIVLYHYTIHRLIE